jgi:hypothetical protein
MSLEGVQLTEAGVTLVLDSEPGEYVGQGERLVYTSAHGNFEFTRNMRNGVSVAFRAPGLADWWNIEFSAPNYQSLDVGTYSRASRYPFAMPYNPGLSVYGNWRGCDFLTGSFEVRQITYRPDGAVESFSAAFEQYCEGAMPALVGEIRSNPFITITAPGSRSIKPGQGVSFSVTAEDVDSRPLALVAAELPVGATFTDNGNGTGRFSWTPSAGQTGIFNVRFEAHDDLGHMDTAATRITVMSRMIRSFLATFSRPQNSFEPSPEIPGRIGTILTRNLP